MSLQIVILCHVAYVCIYVCMYIYIYVYWLIDRYDNQELEFTELCAREY